MLEVGSKKMFEGLEKDQQITSAPLKKVPTAAAPSSLPGKAETPEVDHVPVVKDEKVRHKYSICNKILPVE